MRIKTKDNYVSVCGKKLSVRTLTQKSGRNKPTIVFLHEGLGCIELWKDIPMLLAEATGLNAVIYDRQGYGKSDSLDLPRPNNYLEIEARHYLPELLKQLNIYEPILIGHSDGATIALIYAALHPVRLLITEAAHVIVEEITIKGVQQAVNYCKSNNTLNKLKKYHGDKAEDVFWSWATIWLNKSFKNWNVRHFLNQIKCPCLLIQGENDPYASNDQFQLILKDIGNNANGELLAECAHAPHFEAKEMTLDLMLNFMDHHLLLNQNITNSI
ncbi:alpha/beta hydrolase [Aureispira]|nr:alpha/beta hydrolase [Aureispira sp.]